MSLKSFVVLDAPQATTLQKLGIVPNVMSGVLAAERNGVRLMTLLSKRKRFVDVTARSSVLLLR